MPEMTPLEAAERLERKAELFPGMADLLLYAASYLHKIASGEYAPVIHGRWIKRDIFSEDPLECSNCGNSVSVYGYSHCPSCGALMDGKDDSHAPR